MTNDELQDDLDAYVLGDDELEPPQADEAIEPPVDAEHADALARVLRGVEREQRRIDMLATQEMSRIAAWRDDRLSGLNRRHAFVSSALEGWMRAVNRVNPKRKTEHLPHAKVSLRAGQRSVQIVDAAAFLAWWRADTVMTVAKYVRDHLDVEDFTEGEMHEIVELVLSRSPLVKIKPEPSKSGIKEAGQPGAVVLDDAVDGDVVATAVVIDGELIPGVVFATPAADTFSVTV